MGFTVWFTGLPSSGKSTLARMLEQVLGERGQRVEVLDGDEVRLRLSRGLGFSKEDRDENIRRIAYVAHLVTRCGGVALTCAISPYRALRDEARQEIGHFIEVYVKCALDVCIDRDVKGLYAKALRGEIAAFTGISDPYEAPLAPEVVVETDRETPEESLAKILQRLEALGYLVATPASGMRSLALPRYLIEVLEAQLFDTPFREVAAYVTHLLTQDVEEEPVLALSTEETETVKARLRDLGYLE
ncbi:MAG: adenylyl-sulfate kinase [Candidatus Entotheonellia bacterium]